VRSEYRVELRLRPTSCERFERVVLGHQRGETFGRARRLDQAAQALGAALEPGAF
jgi:hypothetical protein